MIRWNGKDYSPRRYGKPSINQSIEELMKPLSEKKFKGNVWRAGIIGDVRPIEPTTPSPNFIVSTGGYQRPGYSVDGITWSGITEPENVDWSFGGIANNDSEWRAYGASYSYITSATTNVMFSSSNGIDWASGATQGFRSYIGNPNKLFYVAPYWYIGGNSTYAQLLSGGSWTTMAYSSDGLNFNPVNITIPSGRVKNQSILGIAYGNGIYLAVGNSTGTTTTQSRLLYSYDGINWTGTSSSTFSGNLTSIAYGNGKFIIGQSIAGNSKILNTTDGFNFTAATNVNSTTVFGTVNPAFILYRSGRWLAAGAGGANTGATFNYVNYSDDGFTWTGSSNSKSVMPQTAFNYAVNGNTFYAVGRLTSSGPIRLWYSPDGDIWSATTGNFNSIFSGSVMTLINTKT